MNKRIIYQFTIFTLCFLCGYFGSILYKRSVNSTVLERYKNLGLMKYDSEKDAMIPKSDTLIITKWDLWYIQHGTTKGKGY
jgi:hypothetical protein